MGAVTGVTAYTDFETFGSSVGFRQAPATLLGPRYNQNYQPCLTL